MENSILDLQPPPTNQDKPAVKVGLKVATITAVFLLVLFGLYWGGKKLLPAPSEKVVTSVGCDDVYTNLDKALVDAVRDKKPVCGLDISNSRRSKLTRSIFEIDTLAVLSAGNNNIRELPEWIDNLQELRHLDLNNNKLKSLPGEIAALHKLEVLDLRGNPLPQSEVDKVRELLPKADVKF